MAMDEAVFRNADGRPLTLANLPHLADDEAEFRRVVVDTESELARLQCGLAWSDVASVFPFSDKWTSQVVLRPRSRTHRHEYVVRASKEDLRRALVHGLARNELMRSVSVDRSEPAPSGGGNPVAKRWYAVMKLDERMEHLLIDEVPLPSPAHAQQPWPDMGAIKSSNDEDGARVQPPGPMCYFTIVHSPDDPTRCGLLYTMHHCIFDMMSLGMFIADIDEHLGSGHVARHAVLAPPASYGPYAVWRFLYPSTEQHQAHVDSNASRLAGIAEGGGGSMWPPQRAHGWMRGNDAGWEAYADAGDFFALAMPNLAQLRAQHGVSASKVAKAAQILVNMRRSGARQAVFVGAEGGRMVKGVAPAGLDLLAVRGPVVELSWTRMGIEADETTVDFLQRVQRLQAQQSAHAHCSEAAVMARLCDDDVAFLRQCAPRQVFNWAPPAQRGHARITLTKFEGRSDFGISWVFRLVQGQQQQQQHEQGSQLLVVEASWDTCQLSEDEMRECTYELLGAARWLSDPSNARRPVAECSFDSRGCFRYTGPP